MEAVIKDQVVDEAKALLRLFQEMKPETPRVFVNSDDESESKNFRQNHIMDKAMSSVMSGCLLIHKESR